jgi:hypothetical protein
MRNGNPKVAATGSSVLSFWRVLRPQGGIDLPGDIFYLDLDEVRGIVEGDPPGVTYY